VRRRDDTVRARLVADSPSERERADIFAYLEHNSCTPNNCSHISALPLQPYVTSADSLINKKIKPSTLPHVFHHFQKIFSCFQFSAQHKEQCTLLPSILHLGSSHSADFLENAQHDQVPILTNSGHCLQPTGAFCLFAPRRFKAELKELLLCSVREFHGNSNSDQLVKIAKVPGTEDRDSRQRTCQQVE
jgi:hypothetical protein